MALHTSLQNGLRQKFISFASRINVRCILLVIFAFSIVFVTLVFKEVASMRRMEVFRTLTWEGKNVRERAQRRDERGHVNIDDLQIEQQKYFKKKTAETFNFYGKDLNSPIESNQEWTSENPSSDVDVQQRLLAMKDLFNVTTHNTRYPAFDAKIFPLTIESRLPSLNTIKLTPKDSTWQNVSGSSHKIFVYSAYYDRRAPRCVRIISVIEKNFVGSLWCRLWYYNHSGIESSKTIHSVSVPAQVKRAFSICLLDYNLPAPMAVSLVGRLRLNPENLLLVRNTDAELAARQISVPIHPSPIVDTTLPGDVTEKTKANAENTMSLPESNESSQPHHTVLTADATKERQEQQQDNATTSLIRGSESKSPIASVEKVTFVNLTATQNTEKSIAVCVKPINKTSDEVLRLLQFVEVYLLLGVKHFFLYNHTMGPLVECLLRDYMARGIVTLLPWQFDLLPPNETGSEKLPASLNDCLYRTMYAFDFTAFVDLNEFILPRSHATLQQFIRWLNKNMTDIVRSEVGAFSFQQVFFNRQWSDDLGPQIWQKDLLEGKQKTMQNIGYRSHFNKPPESYICRPELTVMAGEHGVMEFVPGYMTLNVPIFAAILHHHRKCGNGEDNCTNITNVIDNTVERYGHLQRMALKRRFSKLQSCWRQSYLKIKPMKKFVAPF